MNHHFILARSPHPPRSGPSPTNFARASFDPENGLAPLPPAANRAALLEARRGSQVVRPRSAKPLCAGSIPARASNFRTRFSPRRERVLCFQERTIGAMHGRRLNGPHLPDSVEARSSPLATFSRARCIASVRSPQLRPAKNVTEPSPDLLKRTPGERLGKILRLVSFSRQTVEQQRERPVQLDALEIDRGARERGGRGQVVETADEREEDGPRHPLRELRGAIRRPGQSASARGGR